MKKVISTSKAPAAIGPYSQAVLAGNTLYCSGQIPIEPATGSFVKGGIKEQTTQVFKNISAILEEAGFELKDVVKVTVLLADISYFEAVNEIYADTFSAPYPARSAFAVRDLPKSAMVEIEVIAVK